MMRKLNHFDSSGQARMVDVGGKKESKRQAKAFGRVAMSFDAFRVVREGSAVKGDVLGIARLAGIMAAKQVDRLIPLAHPLNISKAEVEFCLDEQKNAIDIYASVGITGKTGVEMEALTAVSVAALTIYDMCKSIDKGMIIKDIHLIEKSGGKSGDYVKNM